MMLTRLAGQELIDGLSAVTLGASVFKIAQRKASSLMRPRLGFAFGGLFVLFLARTAFYVLDWDFLHLLALTVVCALPLAALLLSEGVLRRHAPWTLKVLVTLGAAAMAVLLIARDGRAPAATWWLGSYVIPSLALIVMLLLTRDRASLSRQENASVTALVASGALLTALSVTDFLPQTPVGLSGVGAAGVAFVLGVNPSTRRETLAVLTKVLAMSLVAAAGALAFAPAFGLGSLDEIVGLGAILMSLLLASNALLDLGRRGAERNAQDFARALSLADTTDLDSFLASLADQPLLAGMQLAEGAMLAEYDAKALGDAMASRAVWTGMVLGDKQAEIAMRVRDELGDLMARTEATHAMMVSRTPLRIALLTMPDVGPARDIEVDLALFRKLAALSTGEAP
jgi:hypothetical protein